MGAWESPSKRAPDRQTEPPPTLFHPHHFSKAVASTLCFPIQGCIRREGTSEAAPEAVRQAVRGGCRSGWGRSLPLKLAFAIRDTAAGHRLGALQGVGGQSPEMMLLFWPLAASIDFSPFTKISTRPFSPRPTWVMKIHQAGEEGGARHSEAGYGWPVDRGVWTAKTVKRPRQQRAHPQYANYWAPLTRKRHTMLHSAQPQHTNYWAPRTWKRHQQEHRPQQPTESSDPTQHAKGRTGDCPGPREGATTRRNVTQGVGTRPWCWFASLWRRLLASRPCTFRPSVGPNVFWLCQRSP